MFPVKRDASSDVSNWHLVKYFSNIICSFFSMHT
jgi:hypothetical protein